MAIHILTFGGLRGIDDTNGDLDWLLGQHSRAALLVYLAVERRVSRESLIAVFWPESDADNARHALRQSLYQLRKGVGSDWIDSRAHELVVTGDVRVDALAFTEAMERGDWATAVDLYPGAFLDGVHLVDLQSWESWVDARRAQYARAFRNASRELLELRRLSGDQRGVIQIAERWAARDPTDEEAQHRLIEALASAGERTEAMRQYDTYARRMEAEGLRPLDETVALVERLRSESAALPTVHTPAGARPPQPSPSVTPSPVAGTEDVRHATAGPSLVRRPLRLVIAATALMALAVGLPSLRSRYVDSRPKSSPPAIAILPFSVRGGGAAAYLGEGLVSLLSTAVDGAGSVRPIDTRAIFAALAKTGSSVSSPQQGNRVATQLGAAMYVLGGVVEGGGQLQVEAAVYRTGGGCGRPGLINTVAECASPEPIATGVVYGPADSVFSLVDRLAARLLSGLGEPAEQRLVRTASLTTTSLPAFKAYLQGEELMRGGHFEQAADTYLSALAQDSTFAVAYYRLALAREWAPLPGEDSAAASAARHAARLSARDRGLLDAFRQWRSGDAAAAERSYRSILARYPDDLDAWFQLGEILFHHGPLFGRPLEQSEAAWRKVVAYEPRNLFAVTHLARIALVSGRITVVDSLLAAFDTTSLRTDRRLAEIVLLRAVARGDTVRARAVVQDVRRWEPFAVWREAVFLTAFAPDVATMRGVIADLAEDLASPAQRADLLWFVSLLDLAGGRASVARSVLAEAIETERTVPAGRRREGFGDVVEWYAATLPLPYPDSTLERVRRQAASKAFADDESGFQTEMGIGAPIRMEPLRQYALGVLSARLGDTASAVHAAASLERLAASERANALVRDLDRGLRARLAWRDGRPADALRLLETLESRDSQGDVNAIPFVSRANERFLHGELLVSLGRDAEALHWFESLGDGSVTEVPLRALSHLRRAEIHDRLGHRDQAATHYARFVELWEHADRELRPLVDSARTRTDHLTRDD